MKAYRVNLVRSNDHYLLTPTQFNALAKQIEDRKGTFVTIAGDRIRSSEIRSITKTDVDLESCPAYFQIAVKKQGVNAVPEYKKLPTDWIITTLEGRIISKGVSNEDVSKITKAYIDRANDEGRNLEKDKTLRFLICKAHYRESANGGREYLTELEKIPECIKCFPNKDFPQHILARQIYNYGIRQLA